MNWFVPNPKARRVGIHDPATGEAVDAVTLARRVSSLKSAMTRARNALAATMKAEATLRRRLQRASREKTIDRLEHELELVREARGKLESTLYAQEVRLEARQENVAALKAGKAEPKVPTRKTPTPKPVKGTPKPRKRPKARARGEGRWVYRISFNYDTEYKSGGRQTAQVDVFVRRDDWSKADPQAARDSLFQYLRTGTPFKGWNVERVAWQHRSYDERGGLKRSKTNPGVESPQEIDAHLRFFRSGTKTYPGFFRKLVTDGEESGPRELDLNTDGMVIGEEDVDE